MKRWRAAVVLTALAATLLSAMHSVAQVRYETRTVAMFNQFLYFGSLVVPRALAYDARHHELWVADGAADRVAVFNPAGQELFSFASKGRVAGPSRLAVRQDGSIAVIGTDRTKVRLFDYRGEYLRDMTLNGIGEKPVIGAVAFDGDGDAIVADNASSQIFVYRPDGTLKFQFGSNGFDDGQFQSICAIAVDGSGNLVVVDQRAISVQVFDAQGNFLRGWGKHEMGAENFSLPSGLAIDSKEHILVADELRHQVKVFTPEGKLLLQIGGLGGGLGDLSFPTDVAVGDNDWVYVAERGNARVQVFELKLSGESPVESKP